MQRPPMPAIDPKVVVVIIAFLVIAGAGVLIYVTGEFGTGYRFSVSGTVVWDKVGNNYHFDDLDHTAPERDYKILSTTLFSWPWESGDIKIVATAGDQEQTFKFPRKFNTASLLGDSQTFSIEFRHIEHFPVTCQLNIYEEECEGLFNCHDRHWDTDAIEIE